MLKDETLKLLAGQPEWYPHGSELVRRVIDTITSSLANSQLGDPVAARIAADVFNELTECDIKGLFSVGDEHEWARLSLMAREGSDKP